ncbi:TPR-REGION domain-containing protein [Mycena kentingensis (nom. inval.)]|nr:TPR-REGION domain-containing protein [Mycena kentingensis (nom. inval.)]
MLATTRKDFFEDEELYIYNEDAIVSLEQLLQVNLKHDIPPSRPAQLESPPPTSVGSISPLIYAKNHFIAPQTATSFSYPTSGVRRYSQRSEDAARFPSHPSRASPPPSRRSSINSFSFGPQQLVDLYLDANTSATSSLDPNRSILPVSPLRSSPRHQRPKENNTTNRGPHPLANDTFNQDESSESSTEWNIIDRMRLWRHDALMQHLYETAAFWGDKVLSWTSDANDAFWLAQTFFMTHQYSRAERLLTRPFSTNPPKRSWPLNGPFGKGKEREREAPTLERLPIELNEVPKEMQGNVSRLVDMSVACRYLAAQCQVRQGNWAGATEMLGEANPFRNSGRSGPTIPNLDGGIKIEASMCHLRGILMLRLNRGDAAKQCFMEALALDIKCFDAFEQLVTGEMMSPDEEWEFIRGLSYAQQTPQDAEFVQLIYTVRLRKYKHEREHSLTRERLIHEYELTDNADVLFSFADELYTKFRWADCLKFTTRILGLVSIHNPTMPLHIACMYHLPHMHAKLFILAHEMVDREPENPLSWYAVGVWYLSHSKWAEARQYFSKTSLMDPRFAPAWIAFAHTFALEGEHDHAVTAYSTCARMFTGSHMPLMFVGMENIMLSNYMLADEALNAALSMCDGDPLLANELGVMAFNHANYEKAASFFSRALDLAQTTQSPSKTWAVTHLNLGTCYRKMQQFELAEASYQRVLDLDPRHPQALGFMGIVYHLTDRIDKAILKYHEALSVEQLNPHIIELLNIALDQTSAVSPDMSDFKSVVRNLRDKYSKHNKKDVKGKQRAEFGDGDAMHIG